ncbi:MAG: alginate lyase family protein [Acidobacteria bacterium]|nr:alginate lyase family protein [Acidobacteriota bacterium]MBV9144854.1 alginate lyase family protein [Acidobacteriota bacterium]
MISFFTISLISAALLAQSPSRPPSGGSQAPPHTLLLDGKVLAHERDVALAHPDQPDDIVRAARAAADKAMKEGPFSVTQKSVTPPSGDKHDYMSQAPYFWPNPGTPDHLPYIRRDGERNPEISRISDHEQISKMSSVVRALALGYYLTGNAQYAKRAALLLRTWFLDPATRMNPNLEYAQGIPGVNTGRGIGIIESRFLMSAVDGVELLEDSKNWSRADTANLQKWFSEFLNWLQNSTHGKDESASRNNHGSFYDCQVVDFALFVGKRDLAAEIAKNAKQKRIALQIEPDGEQPLELARTKSFSYSAFNLEALTELATLSQHLDVDLWHFQTNDGRSIRRVLDYLLPYALGEKQWTRKQIEPIKGGDLAIPLLEAGAAYKNEEYIADAKRLSSQSKDVAVLLLEKKDAGQ